MSDNQNNKRIARNSLMLYIRTIIITIVAFYTTRITMQLLGAEDYGISNVISGVIGFMAIITNAMVNAAQRFLAFELGKKDKEQFNRTFSMLINIFAIVSVVGVIAMELIGPWMINNYLVLPPERLYAAHWIFQFSIVGFVASTMVIPFTSVVIAYEKMDVFAYVSLLDAGLKLGVVFLLYITSFDKLITVVFLTVLANVLSNVVYVIYCRYKSFCTFKKYWDNDLLKRLSSFMGWNLFGTATGVLNVQGQAILLNMFFGPLINAAKAIADKIDYGSILLPVKEQDLGSLETILQKNPQFPTPKIKLSIYKNRRGRYKSVILWCDADLGTCRIKPMFMTDFMYEWIGIDDLKIIINDFSPFEEDE